ncbi:MAG: bifunctional nuclease family protein [Flavobacteriales bacterium]|nr:bifunctional nuclease family protein [Flavobacteriales bacterium]
MKTVQLNIIGLTYSQSQSNAYALLLGEEKGNRRLPIVIGAFEAQSIAVALEKKSMPPRPLTHDLFTSLALSYNIYLKEVMIHKLKNGIFYSTLVCELNGEIKQIDSRTSDAIALALRFNCPIYTYEGILKQAGIILDEKETTNLSLANNSSKTLGGITTKESLNFNITEQTKLELKSKLTVALEKEDYKLAALIRDELNRRTL